MEMSNQDKFLTLLALLTEIQWRGEKVQAPQHLKLGTCPVCARYDKHASGCRLDDALKMHWNEDVVTLRDEQDYA